MERGIPKVIKWAAIILFAVVGLPFIETVIRGPQGPKNPQAGSIVYQIGEGR